MPFLERILKFKLSLTLVSCLALKLQWLTMSSPILLCNTTTYVTSIPCSALCSFMFVIGICQMLNTLVDHGKLNTQIDIKHYREIEDSIYVLIFFYSQLSKAIKL
jgi:hypothetical protein